MESMSKAITRIVILGLMIVGGVFALMSVAGAAVIQGQNSSSGGSSFSGDAFASNSAVVRVGPQATGGGITYTRPFRVGGGGNQAQQIGNNNIRVRQVAIA